jgi:hypothetical protein
MFYALRKRFFVFALTLPNYYYLPPHPSERLPIQFIAIAITTKLPIPVGSVRFRKSASLALEMFVPKAAVNKYYHLMLSEN